MHADIGRDCPLLLCGDRDESELASFIVKMLKKHLESVFYRKINQTIVRNYHYF